MMEAAEQHGGSPSPITTLQCPEDDHHSALTHSTEDDENFIALLQYRDAYHILNLTNPDDNKDSSISKEIIKDAYDVAKEQAMYALEQFEATHSGGRKNMFYYSQLNFLELKLQALDQAYDELLPEERAATAAATTDKVDKSVPLQQRDIPRPELGDDNRGNTDDGAPSQQHEVATPIPIPIQPPADDAITDKKEVAVVKSSPAKSSQSDDELDTIDIYFQPSPKKDRKNRPKSPAGLPSDVSSCTWDESSIGGSIFSMLSQTKKTIDDAVSESGLSDVLGPPKTITPGDTDKEAPRRPPLSGINVKQRPQRTVKAQISPTSVTDWKVSIHNDDHYDNSNGRKSKVVVGRGRMMKNSRVSSPSYAAAHYSHQATTEAARMGILRALSEDNSECLPIDDDEYRRHDYLNTSNETQGVSEEAKFHNTSNRRKKTYFQGKSDRMHKDSNSLMASQLSGRQESEGYTSEQGNASERDNTTTVSANISNNESSSPDRTMLSKSVSEASSLPKQKRSKKQSKSRHNTERSSSSTSIDDTKNNSYNSDPTPYDDILQAGIDLADELCMAVNNCWNPSVGCGSSNDSDFVRRLSQAGSVASAAASAAVDAAKCELERGNNNPMDQSLEEETMYTRSSYGDTATYGDTSTYVTRRTEYTSDGESTAFNTTSSFSRVNCNPYTKSTGRGGRGGRGNETTDDPPPRMLV